MILADLLHYFIHKPTHDQLTFFYKWVDFYHAKDTQIFILKGYAGTGKSSITQSIVQVSIALNRNCVLMAPTGRAAKVLQHYAKYPASTIHSQIYQLVSTQGNLKFRRKKNKFKNTLFIIDEASMLGSNEESKEGNGILEDVFNYIFESKSNNKLLLIGDQAQLPPIFFNESPALLTTYFSHFFRASVEDFSLTQIMRQDTASGILINATRIRNQMENLFLTEKLKLALYPDCYLLEDQYEVENILVNNITQDLDEFLIIVRSNKRANLYNEQIRKRILMRESVLERGDRLMIVRNNYFWLPENSPVNFIANGEMIRIERVYKEVQRYDFHFAEVQISFVDFPDLGLLDTVLWLNTLTVETAAMSYEARSHLFEKVLEDYALEATKTKKISKLRRDPYFNALEVKFSYAVTCHKAQGGQWNNVLIEKPYHTQEDETYLRWLYTAMTRAKKQIYLIGFKEVDFISI